MTSDTINSQMSHHGAGNAVGGRCFVAVIVDVDALTPPLCMLCMSKEAAICLQQSLDLMPLLKRNEHLQCGNAQSLCPLERCPLTAWS